MTQEQIKIAIEQAIDAMKYANERYAGDNSLRLTHAIDALEAAHARYAGESEPVGDVFVDELLDLLETVFSLYEDGPDCYEDPYEPAGYIGKALRLDEKTFSRIAEILNEKRPVTAMLTASKEDK